LVRKKKRPGGKGVYWKCTLWLGIGTFTRTSSAKWCEKWAKSSGEKQYDFFTRGGGGETGSASLMRVRPTPLDEGSV